MELSKQFLQNNGHYDKKHYKNFDNFFHILE